MNFDAIIIGTGQAGPPLASSLAKNGYNTAIIEKGHLGGSCVNVGCTPTKAYVASARRAFIARNSSELGVKINGEVIVDLQKIKKRKDQIINDSRSGLEKMLTGTEGITLIRGQASIVDDHTILVNDKKLSAHKIYFNVGTRPRITDGFEDVPYLTNESILELEEIPEHLVIVGGGYIGLEFGQMFRRFGSKVTILERGSRLFKKEDPDISDIIEEVMVTSGVGVLLNSDCIHARQEGEKITIQYNRDSNSEQISASHLLLATGRIPNTDLLNLEKAGIKAKIAEYAMSNVARAKEMGETTGKLKIYIDAGSNKMLGASLIGAGADEFIHTIIDQMYAEASYEVIRDAVHIHPTISELIPTMLESPKNLS